MGEDKAKLSEEDIEKIVNKIEERFEQKFYLNLGKGLWNIVWRLAVLTIIGIAAYGTLHGGVSSKGG